MNTLVLYGSQYGQTAKIANALAETLAQHGMTVEVVDVKHLPAGFSIDRYDAALIGSPIVGAKHLSDIARFASRHLDFLSGHPSAFFSVSMSAGEERTRGDAERCVQTFEQETGWRPASVALFGGALAYRRYNPLIRFIMRRIASKEGGFTDTSRDYDYTDWDAVRRFAEAFAAKYTAQVA